MSNIENIDNEEYTKLAKFVQKNQKVLNSNLTKKEMDIRVTDWQLFYLHNLDLFVEDVLGIKLKEFQKDVLADIDGYSEYMLLGSRGISKSFLISLIALSYSLLLPNVNILVVSMTLYQSNLILKEKLDEMITSPKSTKMNSLIAQQLRSDGWINFVKNKDTSGIVCELGNNAKIFATVCGESARGGRSNIIVSDEAVLLPKTIYDRIIQPTSEPYFYKGLKMESKEFFLTSARTRDNWIYKRMCSNVNEHFKTFPPKCGIFAGDIFTSIASGIHTVAKYETAKRTSDDFAFLTEYLNIWLGESANSIFKYENFHKAQVNEMAWYPSYLEYDFCERKNVIEDDNWIKFCSLDIAVIGGKKNDRTALILGRLNIKTNERVIEYIYTASGMNSIKQIEIIKRLFYDYGANYIVIDTNGIGNVMYDIFTTPTPETEYYVETKELVDGMYPAWGVNLDKSLQLASKSVVEDKIKRISDTSYKDVIIPFVGSAETNSLAHYSVWNALRNKNITLLKEKNVMEKVVNDKDRMFFTRSSNELADFYLPFKQTDILINETIALDVTRSPNGQLKVKESDYKDTKDVYISFAMWNMLADKIYNKYVIEGYDDNEWDMSDFEGLYE